MQLRSFIKKEGTAFPKAVKHLEASIAATTLWQDIVKGGDQPSRPQALIKLPSRQSGILLSTVGHTPPHESIPVRGNLHRELELRRCKSAAEALSGGPFRGGRRWPARRAHCRACSSKSIYTALPLLRSQGTQMFMLAERYTWVIPRNLSKIHAKNIRYVVDEPEFHEPYIEDPVELGVRLFMAEQSDKHPEWLDLTPKIGTWESPIPLQS